MENNIGLYVQDSALSHNTSLMSQDTDLGWKLKNVKATPREYFCQDEYTGFWYDVWTSI